MKPVTHSSRQTAIPESSITVYSPHTRRNRSNGIKLLPPPSPPDAETIRRLNDLAAKNPFCILHRMKKHEVL